MYGMTMDSLCFDQIYPDDPSITDKSHMYIPMDALPELKGADFWWQLLPSAGELEILHSQALKPPLF